MTDIQTFRQLHDTGFLLHNAWDAASARMLELSGAQAIGTTSAGMAYTRGRRDGQTLTCSEMLTILREICAAVRVPVTADIEAGYGDTPADVAQTVRGAAEAGAVGLNLEDAAGGVLHSTEDQVCRIAAARTEADKAGGLWINARTDTYFLLPAERQFEATVQRGRAYLEAGADSLFVPPVIDLQTITDLKRELGGKLTVMTYPGAPAVSDLLGAGACRVSLGQGMLLAALGLLAQMTQEFEVAGASATMNGWFIGFDQGEALFDRE